MSKQKQQHRKIHLNRVCRTCLTERGHLREIFNTRIPMMMEYCTTVKVCEDDNLPSHICVGCFHQIAKFYTFKKRVEQSDRFLRNYVKKHKKLDDILDIAVNDAQIEEQNDEVVSDDDIPLSQRVKEENRRALKKSKRKMNKVVDELVEEEKNDCLENDNLNDTPIFTEGPPPLIPLAIKKDPVENTTAVTRTLPANAPPLIPIKPLSTISPKTILNVLSTETQLKLNCTSCNEQFSSISDLKHHKQFSCQSSALQCNICRKEFKERKRLIGHLKGHMIAKNYRCKVCGKCYPNPSTFRVHMRTHTGERPFKCQICGKGFVRWAGVAEHMKTHTSLKPHVCGTCGKGFKIQSNLERHKILHTGNLPFCCSYCGKTFSQSDNLQLHVRTYHTYERPFLCYECGKGFVSSTRLKRHMWVHTGYKPYLCEHCPKAYSNSNDLKNHERTHVGGANKTDKPHKCPSCDMRFYHSCRLAKHMNTHKRPFACSECTKTFSTEALLNKHMVNKHKQMFFVEQDVFLL